MHLFVVSISYMYINERVGRIRERHPRVWEIRSLVPGRVKQMTYKVDNCRSLARR